MQSNGEVERLAYSAKDAAAALGISASTLQRLIESGEIHAVRVTRRVLVPVAELTRFLAGGAE